MNQSEIKKFLESFKPRQSRTIVIVDYGNVEKWKLSLSWKVDIKNLATLVKNFAYGNQSLRRFYYGADYGRDEKSTVLTEWSRSVIERANMNRFEVVKKRVKYIHNLNNKFGFEKKCDLDVEMAVDLIKLHENYDTVIIFSGDGDLMYAVRYLHETYTKECFVFGARDHVGREIYDAKNEGFVTEVLYAEDFEYRLNNQRFWP
ncbi:hypothetical protein CO181_02635 [candidate division WWE3 bacterium CG_4_9_14_3_um_filter_43_9]|uniref:NYN domain-containing protein n=1 Tax=candidate division WWE3 bacterium CG_4_9_14_3_um_filter_43_9 TaxID=1975082 RepID=A0A2M7WXN3_UNCKA|nr:MAG: hypothetical protein CO181_02635 [candidate division WWE3 bacterium CG_4_9_14_3_um_filter_43_9]